MRVANQSVNGTYLILYPIIFLDRHLRPRVFINDIKLVFLAENPPNHRHIFNN